MVQMATLYAEQAKAGGVDISIKKWPADTYYSGPYMKQPFFSTDWAGRSLVPQFFIADMTNASYNEQAFHSHALDKIVLQAIGETRPARRHKLLVEAQSILWNQGGYIIPVFRNNVDAMSTKVHGIGRSVFRSLGGYMFNDTYKTA
jgi:peptide/nickel transport system substrate-binding protein